MCQDVTGQTRFEIFLAIIYLHDIFHCISTRAKGNMQMQGMIFLWAYQRRSPCVLRGLFMNIPPHPHLLPQCQLQLCQRLNSWSFVSIIMPIIQLSFSKQPVNYTASVFEINVNYTAVLSIQTVKYKASVIETVNYTATVFETTCQSYRWCFRNKLSIIQLVLSKQTVNFTATVFEINCQLYS